MARRWAAGRLSARPTLRPPPVLPRARLGHCSLGTVAPTSLPWWLVPPPFLLLLFLPLLRTRARLARCHVAIAGLSRLHRRSRSLQVGPLRFVPFRAFRHSLQQRPLASSTRPPLGSGLDTALARPRQCQKAVSGRPAQQRAGRAPLAPA